MKFQFMGKVVSSEGAPYIAVPFNVWEVCDSQGVLSIEAEIDGVPYACNLDPLGKGIYNIPVSDILYGKIADPECCDVCFEITNRVRYSIGRTPYSLENPIRKIDSLSLITQPNDGLCGQTCIAMLAGVSLDDACEIMHCRDWQASMGKMVDTLDYLGLAHEEIIHYTQGQEVELPDCCILMEKMGRYSHYLVYYHGTYFDPTEGILESFKKENLVGYLQIQESIA